MKRFMVRAAGVLSGVALVAVTGCVAVIFAAGAAVGVSGAVWVSGQLRTSLAGSVPQVRDAAKASLEKMGRAVSITGDSPLESTVNSYTGDGTKITITLKSLSATVTEIHIQVGFWGDKPLSHQILNDIDARLGKSAGGAPHALKAQSAAA